jgi:hypothetical protein
MHATTPRLRMLQTLFQHEVFVITPTLNAGSDCELGKIPLYKGMRGMVTQNRNKHLTVVNGRLAHVIQMEGNTLFLKLANENIVQMYPVSFPTDDGTIKNCHTSHACIRTDHTKSTRHNCRAVYCLA